MLLFIESLFSIVIPTYNRYVHRKHRVYNENVPGGHKTNDRTTTCFYVRQRSVHEFDPLFRAGTDQSRKIQCTGSKYHGNFNILCFFNIFYIIYRIYIFTDVYEYAKSTNVSMSPICGTRLHVNYDKHQGLGFLQPRESSTCLISKKFHGS